MTLLKIAQLGEPVLRQRSREVTRDELRSPEMQKFIDDLIETMHDADGAGLAAPQVFLPVRICAIHVRGNNPRYPYKPPIPLTVLVNPVITPVVDEQFERFGSVTPSGAGEFAGVSTDNLTAILNHRLLPRLFMELAFNLNHRRSDSTLGQKPILAAEAIPEGDFARVV